MVKDTMPQGVFPVMMIKEQPPKKQKQDEMGSRSGGSEGPEGNADSEGPGGNAALPSAPFNTDLSVVPFNVDVPMVPLGVALPVVTWSKPPTSFRIGPPQNDYIYKLKAPDLYECERGSEWRQPSQHLCTKVMVIG